MKPVSRRRSRLELAGLTAALITYLLGVSLATSPASYSSIDLALITSTYLLLALAIRLASLAAIQRSQVLGGIASAMIAGATLWHLREQIWIPSSKIGLVCGALVLGAADFWLARRVTAALSPRAALAAAGIAWLVFGSTIGLLFHTSPVFRWHLLRHNKLIGTPAYFVFADPVHGVSNAMWSQRQQAGEGRKTAAPAGWTASANAPDIVFIVIDTMRADVLEAWGDTRNLAPELNQLARQSVVFGDVMANSAWTRPSVASFFTGRLPEQHGAVDRPFQLPETETTLAEHLSAGGYDTAAFVTNYGAAGRDAGFSQGFDVFEQVASDDLPYARAEELNQIVTEWLGRRGPSADRPLFLYVHYLDPHDPYLSGGSYASQKHAEARRSYDNEIRYVDRHVADLVRSLETRLGRAPFVLIASDHGEEFGEHLERGHGRSLYREVIHIPALVISGAQRGRSDARLEGRDFFHLLLEAARNPSLQVAEWSEARSRKRRHTSIYSSTPFSRHRPYLAHVCMRGIDSERFFASWSAYGNTWELYDNISDPGQTTNLARREPKALKTLEHHLDADVGKFSERIRIKETEDTIEMLRALGYVE